MPAAAATNSLVRDFTKFITFSCVIRSTVFPKWVEYQGMVCDTVKGHPLPLTPAHDSARRPANPYWDALRRRLGGLLGTRHPGVRDGRHLPARNLGIRRARFRRHTFRRLARTHVRGPVANQGALLPRGGPRRSGCRLGSRWPLAWVDRGGLRRGCRFYRRRNDRRLAAARRDGPRSGLLQLPRHARP